MITFVLDPKCYKSILSEFAFRTNGNSPKYTTIQQDNLHPVYVSSLVFDGETETYIGQVGRSNIEAEQLVARIAIESLLGTFQKLDFTCSFSLCLFHPVKLSSFDFIYSKER